MSACHLEMSSLMTCKHTAAQLQQIVRGTFTQWRNHSSSRNIPPDMYKQRLRTLDADGWGLSLLWSRRVAQRECVMIGAQITAAERKSYTMMQDSCMDENAD